MRKINLLVAVVFFFALTGIVSAQGGGAYTITRYSFNGGSGQSVGGNFALSGSIGQAEAGGTGSETYTLGGGFWPETTITQPPNSPYQLYLPLVLRQ